jgi:hypothetical protein
MSIRARSVFVTLSIASTVLSFSFSALATKVEPQKEVGLLDFEKFGYISCSNSAQTVLISKIRTNTSQDLLLLKPSTFDSESTEIDLSDVKITTLKLQIIEAEANELGTGTVTSLHAKVSIEGKGIESTMTENLICDKVDQETAEK